MVADIRKYLTASKNAKEEAAKNSTGPKKTVVTDVHEKTNGSLNPVIVSFQNGNLNDHQLSGLRVSLTANKNGETNVEVETSYGHVFKDSHVSEIGRPKQMIAIRNRKTNKVRIVECDNAILINSALLKRPEVPKTETDYSKEMRNLNRTFGGKKLVSRLDQREKLNISSIPIADEVKKVVEEIKVEDNNTSLNDTESESILHLLPPCHRDATALSDVYVISEILSEEELYDLQKEHVRRQLNKFGPHESSEFYEHCYLETKKTSENLDVRLAGILFAEVLVQFLKIPMKKLNVKRMYFCQFSSLIYEKVLNEFCIRTESSVSRPMAMRDKCVCFIITICLICCNYRVNLKLLSTCIAVHLAKLTRLARAVGAVPAPKEDGIFVLKLPLPALPKTTARKNRRK